MKDFKQIAIVGTGPGHPDYMTQRAVEYIKQADVILYDCLVDEVTLTIIPENIEQVRVQKNFRKSNGVDIFDQNIIKEMLKQLESGKKVVRIKPGDSLNYNSGGMEIDFLKSKGYDVELVPGVPTDWAAANLLRLNLTEIGQSNGFMSLMADELKKDGHMIPHISYLIENGNMPVCLYGMFPETFQIISEKLISNGVDPKMPVAICADVSLDSMELFKTNIQECSALMTLMASEEAVPGHFIVIIGRYILTNYVEFKLKSQNQTTC